MRVVLVARGLGERGGAERSARAFALAALEAGWILDAVLWDLGGAPRGVRVRPWPGRGWVRGALGKLAAGFAAGWGAPAGVARVGWVRTPGCTLWRAADGCGAAGGSTGWARAAWDLAEARAVAGAGRIVANSPMVAAQLALAHPAHAGRIVVVPNGVDLARFQPGGRGEAAGDLVFLGNGYRRKGLDLALAALARVPRLRLHVAGAERRLGPWRDLAARLGVADRVRWRGPTTSPERLLPGARALLLPTRYDAYANVCLEALACGVPVVTTATNGAASVLGGPALAVAPPRADALAEALERVLQVSGDLARSEAERFPSEASAAALLRVVGESWDEESVRAPR